MLADRAQDGGMSDGRPRHARLRRRPPQRRRPRLRERRAQTREQAVVSVFDAGFVLGDGVWEGLRVHHGHPCSSTGTSIGCTRAPSRWPSTSGARDELTEALCDAAGERHDRWRPRAADGDPGGETHALPGPRVTVGPATVVMIPEYKEPLPAVVEGASGCSRCTCGARTPTCSTPSSTSTASSTTSWPASRRRRQERRGAHARPT